MGSHRVLVAYGSKHGATAEIAEWVGEALRKEGLTVDVQRADRVQDLCVYGAAVIGGALYMGRWPRETRNFARWFRRTLADAPVWLFSSGPLDHSADTADLPPAPSVARLTKKISARGHATFGGFIDAETPGRMAHAIAAKSAGDYRNRPRIEAWARSISAELMALAVGREHDASRHSMLPHRRA